MVIVAIHVITYEGHYPCIINGHKGHKEEGLKFGKTIPVNRSRNHKRWANNNNNNNN